MIQQQVKEIKFQEVFIQKIKQRAYKTNKIGVWLSLLKAYQENNLYQERDNAIEFMHLKFILNEQFWIQEIKRKENVEKMNEREIEFIMMALEDGYYETVAQMVYQILIKQLNKSQSGEGNMRPNFLIAKIQKIIATFKRSKNFFKKLREYYKLVKNQKKVRELYMREIRYGYDDVDIVYDEYLGWEKNREEAEKSRAVYEAAKINWQQWNENGAAQFTNLTHTDRVNFDPLNYWKLVEKLETDTQKLRNLRIVFLGRHQLATQYFQLLQCVNLQDQDYVIQRYKNVLDIAPQIQLLYLKFLVRRINKHTQQSQNEEYNTNWAAKVQFFRQQITTLISKPRLSPILEQSIKQLYYNYWIDVETSLIKDKQSVCQLFEALLQLRSSVQSYAKYSSCMVRLGYLADAKHILKRCCEAFKYDCEAYTQYENFIAIYGAINDAIEYGKLKMAFQDKQRNENNENHINNHAMDKQEDTAQRMKGDRIKNHKEDKQQAIKIKQMTSDGQISQEKNGANKQQFNKAGNEIKNQQKNQTKNQTTQQPSHNDPQLNESQPPKQKMHTDSGNTLYIKGFPQSWKQEQIRSIIHNKDSIKQVRLIQKKGIPQNYCYVQMISAEDAEKEIRENQHKNQYYIAISKPPSAFNEDKTLFLAGLPQTATVEKVKNLFKDQMEHIVDVRIKINDQKHIAYVDFDTIEVKNKAYEKYSHQTLLMDDKKVLVRESNSKPMNAKKEYRVILLKELAFKAKQKDIVEFFKNYSLEDVYIPQGQNRKSKGFAFVKFKNINQFNEALEMKKGIIKGRTFYIHRSDRDIQRPKSDKNDGKAQKVNQVNNNYFNDLFK